MTPSTIIVYRVCASAAAAVSFALGLFFGLMLGMRV